jgi:hypothetical protein
MGKIFFLKELDPAVSPGLTSFAWIGCFSLSAISILANEAELNRQPSGEIVLRLKLYVCVRCEVKFISEMLRGS